MSSSELPRLHAVVTGANSGVGLGISTRLLLQVVLASATPYRQPSDSLAQKRPFRISPMLATSYDCPFFPNAGITLILACRSEKRALGARQALFDALRAELAARVPSQQERERLLAKVDIVWEGLDLSEMANVHDFVTRVQKSYPYITHLFNNAGVGAWGGIDWPAALYEVATDPIKGMTDPAFKKQVAGWKSEKDGLGWVWQCNTFSHWCLTQALLPQLKASPFAESRVVWTSSFLGDGAPPVDFSDLQCVETLKSYDVSKRQVDLLAARLDRQLRDDGSGVRSLVADPAVTATEIFRPQLGLLLYQLMMAAFYFVRLVCNSQNHPIDLLSGTIAFVHVALLPDSLIPVTPSTSPSAEVDAQAAKPADGLDGDGIGAAEKQTTKHVAVKFRSQADRWGRAYVRVASYEWDEHEADRLVAAVEELRAKWGKALGGWTASRP